MSRRGCIIDLKQAQGALETPTQAMRILAQLGGVTILDYRPGKVVISLGDDQTADVRIRVVDVREAALATYAALGRPLPAHLQPLPGTDDQE